MAAKKPKPPRDDRGWPLANYTPPTPVKRQPSKDNILQRIVGETLIMGSHPEGFMKGVEARVNELDRAKHTSEAEKILVELVTALDEGSNRIMSTLERAKAYLRKRGIDYSTE